MARDIHVPVILLFVGTFGAFLLLALTTFSVPLSSLYFMYSSQAGGVRFGVWGWCIDEDGTCLSPLQLGYQWEPQITGSITNALVFYPISAILALLSLISFIPVAYAPTPKNERVSFLFILSSFISSSVAFLFMIGIWNVARGRFHKRGFDASFGPLPWMSLVASVLLMTMTLTSRYTTTRLSTHHRPTPADTGAQGQSHHPRRSKPTR